ncbi:hypothetical protein KI387_040489, partial [Taxus chinensis]
MEGNSTISGNAKRLEIVSSWDCGSPLYDSYELVSMFNQLDRGLAALHRSSTPPLDPHCKCQTSWISSHTQKLKRTSRHWQYTSGFDNGERRSCKRKVNKKHPLTWLFRLPSIVSHRTKAIKAIPSRRGDGGQYPCEEQIIKEDGQTRK